MKKKILIIDDEEHLRSFLKRILNKAGYDVSLAPHGEEALSLLSNTSVDLIMLDMNMPRMDGLKFLKEVRKDNLTPAPVLMISGSDSIEKRLECYRLGAYDFIEKPMHNEIMLKRIENGLKIGEMIHFNEFIKTELFMAKKLQNYLFPEGHLLTENVSILSMSRPLSDIGGDLYDYIEFRDGRIVFFVADVSGHSISAALFTAIVSMVFRNAIKVTDNPGEILRIMNIELSNNIPVESFVTLFCGLIDPGENTLSYANAGHPKPFFISGKDIDIIHGNDPFLGPIRDAEFETFTHPMKKGDSILIVTDGFLDIINENKERIGQSLIEDTFTKEKITIEDKFAQLHQYIDLHPFAIADDCTMMLVHLK